MIFSIRQQPSARRLHRSSRVFATGLFAAAALVAGAQRAHAACSVGAVQSCIADDGCAGVRYCEDPYWGECMAIEDCHAPPGFDPNGSFDVMNLENGNQTMSVYGWALDKDFMTTPLQVQVIVDGHVRATLTANQHRPDVGAAYPGAGDYHGFHVSLPAEPVGRQHVCIRAVNLGGGNHRTIGCKDYNITSRVTTSWGELDNTRCVWDPIDEVRTLPTGGTDFGFTTSTDSEGLGYFPETPHLQGITRLAFGDGLYTVVSRSGSYAYYVVRQGGQEPGGFAFHGGVTAADQVVFRMGNNPGIGLDHAGGISSLGTLLAVPNENNLWDDPAMLLNKRTHVDFYDMSNPASPQHLGILGRNVLPSAEAGTAAMARLTNNRILLAVGRSESNWIDFYTSAPGQVGGWALVDSWHESERMTDLPDGDDEFGDYQSLTFVTRCTDGQLFLLGTHRDGDITGDDWVDLFRLDIDGDYTMLTKVAKRHVSCSGHCNLDASGGGYVAPDGRLIVYGTEHGAGGPTVGGKRSVRAHQF